MKKITKKIIIFILKAEARFALWRWKPKIVAVTGSVGKTSTKDAIFSVFSKLSTAQKSEKSFNSEIGVPLAILGLENPWNNIGKWFIALISGLVAAVFERKPAEWMVLEIGADRPRDIEMLTKWIKPDIGVLNMIGKMPVHVEFFDTPEDVAKEKEFLVKAIKPKGMLVYYADDEVVANIAAVSKKKSISFGFSDRADVTASNYTILYENEKLSGLSVKINYEGKSFPLKQSGTLGRQQIYAAMASVAAAMAAGFNVVSVLGALREHHGPPGRMRLIAGIKGSTIIDDTYNSSPAALAEALATLGEVNVAGRRVAVLGDMRELGKHSDDEHKSIGRLSSTICDLLVTVGESGRKIAEGAMQNGMDESKIFQYENSVDAGKDIQNMILQNDVVLVKGSQGVRMEKIVEEIMMQPDKAPDLIVRQESEWKKR